MWKLIIRLAEFWLVVGSALSQNHFCILSVNVPTWYSRTNSYQDILSEATKRSALDLGSDNIPLKQKKKMDRFDGMPEEEVAKKFLPDHLGPNMDILIVSFCISVTHSDLYFMLCSRKAYII